LESVRKVMSPFINLNPVVHEGVHFGQVQIPVDGGEILAYTYWPDNAKEDETFPFLINYHGGGHCLGHASIDHSLCTSLVTALKVTVLNVDYRLAPEYPYPAPPDDCYAALKWAVNHTSQLKADLGKGFIVCGASAGGNLAAVMAILARDDPSLKIKPTGQVLMIPELYTKSLHPLEKYKDELQSMDELTDNDPILVPRYFKLLHDAYEKNCTEADLRSFKRSPLLADRLDGLPPAFFQVCGKDPLRDEGILYSKFLEQAIGEGKVKLKIYPAATHAFQYSVPHVKAAKTIDQDTLEGVEWLLQGTK